MDHPAVALADLQAVVPVALLVDLLAVVLEVILPANALRLINAKTSITARCKVAGLC